jgi:hypothetical protein
MIEFTHKEIVKIVELLEWELDKLNNHKVKTVSALNFNQDNPGQDTDYYQEDRKKYEKEIEFIQGIIDKYDAEISKVKYKFGSAETREPADSKVFGK